MKNREHEAKEGAESEPEVSKWLKLKWPARPKWAKMGDFGVRARPDFTALAYEPTATNGATYDYWE